MKFDIQVREDIAVHEDWKAERGIEVLTPDLEPFALTSHRERKRDKGSGDGSGSGGYGLSGDGWGIGDARTGAFQFGTEQGDGGEMPSLPSIHHRIQGITRAPSGDGRGDGYGSLGGDGYANANGEGCESGVGDGYYLEPYQIR